MKLDAGMPTLLGFRGLSQAPLPKEKPGFIFLGAAPAEMDTERF